MNVLGVRVLVSARIMMMFVIVLPDHRCVVHMVNDACPDLRTGSSAQRRSSQRDYFAPVIALRGQG
jgi:uncharacterized membrane protein